MPSKIAIVMSHDSWKLAPFDDPSWVIWALAWNVKDLPRCDLAFEIHRRDQWHNTAYPEPAKYPEYLRSLPPTLPIFMTERQEDIPTSLSYPLAEVQSALGWEKPHFASSVSYALAFAAYVHKAIETVTEVGLWGVELAACGEWAYQRPNANRLVGFLEGMGVKVSVPKECLLLGIPYQYGYEALDDGNDMANAFMFESFAQLSDQMFKAASAYATWKKKDEERRKAECEPV